MINNASPPSDSRPILFTEIVEMGGAERSMLALARWLYARQLPVHVVTYAELPKLESFATHPLTVVQLRPKMDSVHKVLRLREYFASRPGAPKPLTSGYQPALHATLAGQRGFHCLMHDTPSLLSGANGPRTWKQRVGRTVSDRIVAHGLQSGGKTIVASQFLQADCQRTFGVEADVIRMGGLASTRPTSAHPVTTSLQMLSVSRLEPNKRLDWVLRALGGLEQEQPALSAQIDWHLDIAGNGSQMEPLRALASQLGIANRVHLRGYVSDEELQQMYDRAHLFLMPAVQGYGIPAVESIWRGIPVLLHRASGVSDILLDTPWATVFEGGEEAMGPALRGAIDSVREGRHLKSPAPPMPTEDGWAEQVATLCGWVPSHR